jgi:Ser/Thr protein kinase RdoA (MazF antagonist)
VCEAPLVDLTDARHREVVTAAWHDFGDPRRIVEVHELSAMVSTNRVYRLELEHDERVIVKTSSYGSFFLFAEDHDRLHRAIELLHGGPYEHFLARVLTRDGKPYLWYDGEMWAVLYEEVAVRDRLPRILTPGQVAQLGAELARFHRACAGIARLVPPPSKTAKSDAVNLFEMLAAPSAGEQFGLDQSRLDLVRRHTHRFLMAVHETGYDYWPKMPVLIDWNLGNFSVAVEPDDPDAFTLFSRWDYDWFRIESRLLDFYFLSRVSSRTGDRTTFTYASHTLLEPRFRLFLRSYHRVFPLSEPEVLFLKEAYRFFLLNYVVREGRHFFRYEFWQHLLHDAVDVHLPGLDDVDLGPLLDELT